MRCIVASDIHGSTESLEILLARTREQKPDHVVLLGDLLYHGPRNPLPGHYGPRTMPDGFRELMELCPVTAVRGNCDAEVDLFVLPFRMPESAWLMEDGLEIFVSHGHHIPETPPMGGFPRGTIFLRGHTHVPRGENIDGWVFWNPGSMTLPKQGLPRSYGVIDNGVFQVRTLDDEVILEHSARS